MTVEPGFYNSPFVSEVIKKINDFHYFYPDKPISVDGGINPDNIKDFLASGVEKFAVGSYIFQAQDIAIAINKLLESIK